MEAFRGSLRSGNNEGVAVAEVVLADVASPAPSSSGADDGKEEGWLFNLKSLAASKRISLTVGGESTINLGARSTHLERGSSISSRRSNTKIVGDDSARCGDTMAEIKHRKCAGGGSGPSPPCQSSPSCSTGPRGAPAPSKRPPHGSARCKIVWALAPTALALILTTSSLRSPPSRSRGSSAATNRDRPTFSYSTLRANGDERRQSADYGEAPLAGVYELGGEAGGGGVIQFPRLDLSDVLPEEADRRTFGVFHQGPLRKGGESPPPSFLDGRSLQTYFNLDGGASDDRALLTRKGYKDFGKTPNQDRSFVARVSFDAAGDSESSARPKPKPGGDALLVGLFDGHGGRGHAVSHYAALELPHVFLGALRRTPKKRDDEAEIKRELTEAFLKVDEREPVKGTGGSTACVFFYPGRGSKMYVANAGDSTALIARYSKATKRSSIVFQNRKHKPHLEDERKRIERAGGQVMIPPGLLEGNESEGLKDTSRVIIPDPTGNPFGGLALAMSRSIGDFDGRSVGLIAEPEVDAFEVDEHVEPGKEDDAEWFVVVASDGLYDVLAPEVVVSYLGGSLFDPENAMAPLEACERLIREASRKWTTLSPMPYRDDITLGASEVTLLP
ncbi:hypothetical protein ACHAWF_002556 [Thalassiosira exigua]